MYVTPKRHCGHDAALTWFAASYGPFIGRWRGEPLVALGRAVDVELDFDDCPWSPLEHASEHCFAVNDQANQVDAVVEQIWDDGVVGLRVGDEVVLWDPSRALGPDLQGSTIRLSGVRIEVFPTGL